MFADKRGHRGTDQIQPAIELPVGNHYRFTLFHEFDSKKVRAGNG
jgi:hypothetical protein